MIFSSRISGVGMFAPPRKVKNKDLETMLDTSDEWIVTRTGIRERRWVEGTTAVSDLAFEASKGACKDAGIETSEIDCIILATLSPDHDFPGSACFLQAKLGLKEIPAIDLRQQCTGFIYALSIADHFIRLGTYKNILVVGSEVHSKGLDRSPAGREVSVLFGDGAGAVVVTRAEADSASRIISTHLHAEGAHAKELWLPAPGSAYLSNRLTKALVEEGEHFPKMNGKHVFVHAVKRMSEAVNEALTANQIRIEDVDLFLFHQANLRINEKVAEHLSIPATKVFNTIEFYGNTTSATIPIGLYEAKKAGKLKEGSLVVMAAFGSGFTWASAVIRW